MRRDFDSTRRDYYFLCLLIVSQFSVGCGGQDGPAVAPVKGVVTVNGKPLEGLQVSFSVMKGASTVSSGVTNDKGEYELTTFNMNDGAIVGENLVAIRQMPKDAAGAVFGIDPEAMKAGKSDFKGPDRSMEKTNQTNLQNSNGTVLSKYGNAEKSGLKRTVVLGSKNEFNFDLKP